VMGQGFKFPSSRRYLWDRTAAAPPFLIDCKVGGQHAAPPIVPACARV
jgi:hypothetical protein